MNLKKEQSEVGAIGEPSNNFEMLHNTTELLHAKYDKDEFGDEVLLYAVSKIGINVQQEPIFASSFYMNLSERLVYDMFKRRPGLIAIFENVIAKIKEQE